MKKFNIVLIVVCGFGGLLLDRGICLRPDGRPTSGIAKLRAAGTSGQPSKIQSAPCTACR